MNCGGEEEGEEDEESLDMMSGRGIVLPNSFIAGSLTSDISVWWSEKLYLFRTEWVKNEYIEVVETWSVAFFFSNFNFISFVELIVMKKMRYYIVMDGSKREKEKEGR